MDLEKIIKSLLDLKTSFSFDYSETEYHGKKDKSFKIRSKGLISALLIIIIIPFLMYIFYKCNDNDFNKIISIYSNKYSTYITDTINTSYNN